MQKICLYLLFGLILSQKSFAQQIKTEVMVLGSGAGAATAGIQSARSGVKTLWITENEIKPTATLNYLSNSTALQNGIWAEILRNYSRIKDKDATLPEKIELRSDSLHTILKTMADTVKNLKIISNYSIKEIKKSGNGWEIRLNNGQKVKTKILLDASTDHYLLKKLNSKLVDSIGLKVDWRFGSGVYFRTSVAALDSFRIMPLQNLIPIKTENVIALPAFGSLISEIQAGQAAGATAAYCAFFKTDTKNLNTRSIQSELLTYKSALIPFGDIWPSDSNFIRLQHVAITGIMNTGLKQENGRFYFMPENTLSTEELKNPMKAFYSRSQIWFADHSSEKLSIEETISLLMYTATRGEELKREIEKGWKNNFGFKSEYQPKRSITRYEFAVLLDTYLQPFSVKVDVQGELLN